MSAPANGKLMGAKLIEQLANPASIAIVGASSDLTSTSGRPLAHLLNYGYPGRIVPINPKRDEVGGVQTVHRVNEIEPGSVDVAMVLLAAPLVAGAVGDLARAGVKATIAIASGVDPSGRAELERVAAESGMRIIGPNCLGSLTTASSTYLITSSIVGRRRPSVGRIALVTQSGAMGNLLLISLHARGVGLSHWLSTGDEVDVSALELVTGLLYQPDVSVVGVFMEGLGNLEWLPAMAEAVGKTGKQVIVLKAARTDAGRFAAAGHTGRVVGSAEIALAVMREAGMEIVDTLGGLADALIASEVLAPLPGRRVAIASVSGGTGVMAADSLRSSPNLELAAFEDDPVLKGRLGGRVTRLENPLDMPVWDTHEFAGWVNALASSPRVDAVVVAEAGFVSDETVLAEDLATYRGRTAATMIVPLAESEPPPVDLVQKLSDSGVVVMPSVERAIAALNVIASRTPPTNAESRTERAHEDHDDNVLGLEETVRILGDGWPWVKYTVTTDLDEATSGARAFGFPVVIKAAGRTLQHRSDTGAVAVGVTAAAFAAEFSRIAKLAAASGDQVMIQEQITGSLEVMVSGIWDPETGPVALLRPGGIVTELISEQAIVWGGWSTEVRRRHIESSIVGTLLGGYRGGPVGDLAAIANLVDRILDALSERRISFLELNPVLVAADRVTLVDALAKIP